MTLRIDVYALGDLTGHCYGHFAFVFTLMCECCLCCSIAQEYGEQQKWVMFCDAETRFHLNDLADHLAAFDYTKVKVNSNVNVAQHK